MKILATRQNLTIKDIAGKDLWLKCYHDLYEIDCYVKVYEVFQQPHYSGSGRRVSERCVYSEIPAFCIDEHALGVLGRDEYLEDLQARHQDDLDRFTVCQPVNILTTEEIIDVIKSLPASPF